MDFYELLDDVVTLLRQGGRVTYRALKRQFQLDDEILDDLKEELIKAKRVAMDENGDVLVWVGDVGSTPAPPPPSPQPVQRPAAEGDRTAPIESPVAAPRAPDAERRQLTVLFCDLVDSTALASQLDPKEWRAVVRAYQDTCAKIIQRYEGHIAQYLGDGLLGYFGYPQAHEDDAQWAVRAGLGMVEAMGTLQVRRPQESGERLAVRVGIHTGLVVVGEMGGNCSGGGTRRGLRAACPGRFLKCFRLLLSGSSRWIAPASWNFPFYSPILLVRLPRDVAPLKTLPSAGGGPAAAEGRP